MSLIGKSGGTRCIEVKSLATPLVVIHEDLVVIRSRRYSHTASRAVQFDHS